MYKNLSLKNKIVESIMFNLIRILSYSVLIALVAMLGFILYNGISAINLEFLTEAPRDEMTKGGIFPAIIGTFYLMVGSSIVSIPIGIATAIYLTEYAKNPKIVKLIRLGINNLAGVPSVVFGLFGLSLFVIFLDFGTSILAGSLTLGFLIMLSLGRAAGETAPIMFTAAAFKM